jgi:HlyD family secretion protein
MMIEHESKAKLLDVGLLTLVAAFLVASCGGSSGRHVISESGTIEATEVDVASKATGELTALLVDEGSQVEVGDTLAAVDHSILELQLAQASAAVEAADAQLQLLTNGARSEDIRRAQEVLRQAEAALNIARDDAARMDTLFRSHSVTKKVKDDTDARLTVASSQHASAEQALRRLQKFARPEELQVAEAQLKQASSARDLVAKTIADCIVVSPAKGFVTNKPMELGELVGRGSIIATVSQLDTVTLMIYVSEIELAWVKIGQSADVRIDAAPERSFAGTVTYISPTAEFTPKNIQTKDERVKLVFGVKIEVPNPEMLLKPGMPADASIIAE